MKYLRALYVKVWDWWRPLYYGRILKKPSTSLNIHSSTLGTKSEVKNG